MGVPVQDIKMGVPCLTMCEHGISGHMFVVEETVNSDYDKLISTQFFREVTEESMDDYCIQDIGTVNKENFSNDCTTRN